MLYEIHMLQPGSDRPRVEHVHGDNWLDALRRGLAAAGLPAPTRNLACDLQDDDSVIITDTGTGHVFRVLPARSNSPTVSSGNLNRRKASGPVGVIRVTTPPGDPGPPTIPARPLRPELESSDDLPHPRDLSDPFVEEDVGDDGLESGVQPMRLQGTPSARRAAVADQSPGITADQFEVPRTRNETEEGVWGQNTVDWEPEGRNDGSSTQPGLATTPTAPRRGDRSRRLDALDREMAELEHLGRDIHDACNFTLDAARAHVPCSAGSVLLIDARDRCLYFAAARGPKAAIVATQRIPLEVGIAGASIRQRQPLNVRDPGRDPRFASSFADSVGYHPRSVLCAPIFAGKKAFGVLELLDREQREAFSDEDVELLALAAGRLGEHFASLLPRRP